MQLNKEIFIAQYIASFCAAWTAQRYDECCAMGTHEVLYNPPIEDAEVLAKAVWEQWERAHP